MGVLLDRARKMFGGGSEEPPPAEPFEVSCACGQRLTGVRSDHRKFLRCSGCGQMLFVLPESCYPMPSPPPGVAPVWPDSDGEAEPEADAVSVEPPSPSPPVSDRVRDDRVRDELQRARQETAAGLRPMAPPARRFSPVRLLLFAVVAVIAGTVVLTVYLGRRAGLKQELAAARDAGLAAVNDGDFKRARRELESAVKSLERYGAGDHAFREFEQFAREVAVFADLLEPTIEQAIDHVRSMSPERAASYLRDTLRSPTLILEAAVARRHEDDEAAGATTLDAKLLIGSEFARVDTAELALFQRLPADAPARVLFGARVRSIEREDGDAGWVVRLVPTSGVWITSTACLEKLGWPVDDATKTLLETQGKWLFEKP